MSEHRLEGAHGKLADLFYGLAADLCAAKADIERLRQELDRNPDDAERRATDYARFSAKVVAERDALRAAALALVRELGREPPEPARVALTLDALRQLTEEKGDRP